MNKYSVVYKCVVEAQVADLEFVFFAVDDDGTDLLIHEDEDGDEQSRDRACHVDPPWVLTERHHEPATVWARGLRNTHAHVLNCVPSNHKPL